MFTVKRFVPAVAALAVLLTACGGTDGDVTTTNDPAAGDEEPPTETPPPATPSPEASEPDPSPESIEPEESVEPDEPPAPPPDDDGSGENEQPGTGDSGAADEPATELTIRLNPGTGGEAQEWTVTCNPSGGTIGNPESACATLDAVSPRDVDPVPRDANCTMVYGGPQTATITGRWDGTKVNLSFSRQNGCEIDRWNTMEPVLPASDGAEL